MKLNLAFALPISTMYCYFPHVAFASSPVDIGTNKEEGQKRMRGFEEKLEGLSHGLLPSDFGHHDPHHLPSKTVRPKMHEDSSEGNTSLDNTSSLLGMVGFDPVRGLESTTAVNDDWINSLSINGNSIDDWYGESVSLSKGGTRFAVGAYADGTNGKLSGKAVIYDKEDDGSWKLVKEIYGGDHDQLGRRVSFSDDGKRLAIATPGGSGGVVVYEESDEGWNQIGTKQVVFWNFALVMSGDGMRFVAGSGIANENNKGAAFIFEWDGDDWVNVGRIDGIIDHENFSTYGVGLSYDGTRLIGGSPFYLTGSPNVAGLVRIYEDQGSAEWNQIAELGLNDGATEKDAFGYCAAMSNSGNRVVAGAPAANAVVVFEDDGVGGWEIIGLIEVDSTWGDFGHSCSISNDGNTIAIGSSSLGVSVYEQEGEDWNLLGNTITVDSPYTFGDSVSLSDNGKAVGIGGPQSGTGIASVYLAPTNTPCVDSPFEAHLATIGGYTIPFFCKWATKGRGEYSCNTPGDLASHCPKTCKMCEDYKCADSEATFVLRAGKEMDCAWLQEMKERKRLKMCNLVKVAKTCRATCNFCE